jgi:hypothetical protein
MEKDNSRQSITLQHTTKEVTFPLDYDVITNKACPNPTLQEVVNSALREFPDTHFANLELRVESDPLFEYEILLLAPRK